MQRETHLAIINAILLRPNRAPSPGSLLVRGGKIDRVLGERRPVLPPRSAVIDARGRRVTPGLIDLHVHGGGGRHFGAGEGGGLSAILAAHARFGTTAILPTLAASSSPDILEIIRVFKKSVSRPLRGARVLGLNLEGPFLNMGKRGAQPLRYIRPPRVREVERILEEADGLVKIMTLAPELDAGFKVISALRRAGVIPAIAHTDADYETTRKAIRAGLSYATHLFNSYPPLHHRRPGAVGAILDSEEIDLEIIADGIHVAPVMIRLLFRLARPDRIMAVTDANDALGGRVRRFLMAGRAVRVEGGAARLADDTLVGSIVPLNRAVENLSRFAGIDFARALAHATLNPARLLGLSARLGDLEKGMHADLVIWERSGAVWKTLVGGEVIHEK
ncbi:MAG: N-acetylglucosamine-6-phosphate deacetylase [Candidatus Aureabacteria bacterium]|nr:N-acetylglucosamine-6-phosphate deacetylase [Candidatus Auribacterota bacterium]